MKRVLHLVQGSDEWKAHRNTPGLFNASELAIVMGIWPFKKRSDFLREKALGIEPEHNEFTMLKFEKGHRDEAAARPIAEEIIDDDLSAMVMEDDYYGVLLSASLDGITQNYKTTFEHKSLNQKLAASLEAGEIPDIYWPQMEAGLMVSGATRCLFMTSEDGNRETMRYAWYESKPELRHKIIAACKQFAEDVKNYQHIEHAERPAPEVQIELPALFVQARGAITASNMEEYGKALAAKLAEVRAIKLVTDQDFSNAKEAAKVFREQCKKLELAKQAMLAQTVTIGEAARMMDAWHEDLRQTALQLEKDVVRMDLAKKSTMVSETNLALDNHIKALETEISPIRLNLNLPSFADAIKGKRNYASMQDALDTDLANAKIVADAAARDIRQKLEWFNATDSAYKLLFPDLQTIIQKPADDFRLTVDSRINEHKQAEEKRLEAERERIRQEEADRLTREAAHKDAQAKAQAATDALNDQRGKMEDATHAQPQATAAPQAPATSTPPITQDQAVMEAEADIRAFVESRYPEKQRGLVRAGIVEFLKAYGYTKTQMKAAA